MTNINIYNNQVLEDYKIAYMSRKASILGRKEVLSGKAKFGIFGDGKEIPQVILARVFKKGDWRSGYYRDQTFMFARGMLTLKQFFAQLYAHASIEAEPASAGRQMNNHFASRYIENGNWLSQRDKFNSAADLSPNGSQMPKLLGLAYASKLYRNNRNLHDLEKFSFNGNEVAFGTIGNAATSEGLFWETINAAGVLQIPLLLSIWDDAYGISVTNDLQTTKSDLYEVLKGFKSTSEKKAISIHKACGYNYHTLRSIYEKSTALCRQNHLPTIIVVTDLTQPNGHSTSGSHERYKPAERMNFEKDCDGIDILRRWLLNNNIIEQEDIESIEDELAKNVNEAQITAYKEYQDNIEQERTKLLEDFNLELEKNNYKNNKKITNTVAVISKKRPLLRKDIMSFIEEVSLNNVENTFDNFLKKAREQYGQKYQDIYSRYLYFEESHLTPKTSTNPKYDSHSESIDGREIINKFFRKKLSQDERIVIFGEDVAKLGGVNLEFENLEKEFGNWRIVDTGIREATIVGQGIGCAIRGLRPVADIQYLDYLIYATQILSDDLASLHYRTSGGQAAPLIIRTKGHRLEGIWHTGSPIGLLLGSLQGIIICVPRNSVQAAGMYQTILNQNSPALVIEVLNQYRAKEICPNNLGTYNIPLGYPEIIFRGTDITVVSYGASIKVASEATNKLNSLGISVELIDIQTIIPFDLQHKIRASIEKTNAVLFVDEDVPGGGTAFMMQQVLDKQSAYDFLDVAPKCLSACPHRSAYGSDGDYFSKPNIDDIVYEAYKIVQEKNQKKLPIKLIAHKKQ